MTSAAPGDGGADFLTRTTLQVGAGQRVPGVLLAEMRQPSEPACMSGSPPPRRAVRNYLFAAFVIARTMFKRRH